MIQKMYTQTQNTVLYPYCINQDLILTGEIPEMGEL